MYLCTVCVSVRDSKLKSETLTVCPSRHPGSTLTLAISAARKTVGINNQLLCGIQVSEDRCQLSAPQAAQSYVAFEKHVSVWVCVEIKNNS